MKLVSWPSSEMSVFNLSHGGVILLNKRFISGLVAVCFMVMLASAAAVGTARASDFKTEGGTPEIITSIPRTMTYQGILKDSLGVPIADSTLDITFRIYDDLGNLEWSETIIGVETDEGGYFRVILGNVDDLDLPFDEDYYLELQVVGEDPMSPLQKLNMSAYSARTDTSDFAFSSLSGGGWVDDGTIVRLETETDFVGIGTTNPGEKLTVAGTIESTSGGIKFPDGTIQTTATTFRTYDSGWFPIANNHSYTKDHNLGLNLNTSRFLVQILVSNSSNGSGAVHIDGVPNHGNQTQGVQITDINTNDISITTGSNEIMGGMNNDGSPATWNNGYCRIILLALE